MSWKSPLFFFLFGLGTCVILMPEVTEAADEPAGAYKAPSPEPTATETLLLEYINRCRADPIAEAQRCAGFRGIPKDVDLDMFRKEMSQESPVPPLVFDLDILKAARWHSHYQILNNQTHMEDAGKAAFTGKGPLDRLRLAGYKGSVMGENICRDFAPDQSHACFVIDWGAGPGHMQPNRGHRRNLLSPKYKLAGIAALPMGKSESKFAVTHDFGAAKGRWVGGVVLNDRNRNRFYDIGEGVGGVALTAGDAKTTSWASGAYALPLPDDAVKLIATISGKNYSVYLPEGQDNIKFDIFVSDRTTFDKNGELLSAAKKIPESEEERRRNALVDLYMSSQGSLFPEDLAEAAHELTTAIATELDKDMAEIRDGLKDGDAAEVKKTAQTLLTKYAKCKARPWFADAVACVQIKQGYLRLEEQRTSGKKPTAAAVDQAVKAQQKLATPLTTTEWKRLAAQLMGETAALAPGAK
jgi:hypothetical protein